MGSVENTLAMGSVETIIFLPCPWQGFTLKPLLRTVSNEFKTAAMGSVETIIFLPCPWQGFHEFKTAAMGSVENTLTMGSVE
jgi:hypothetical protein